MRNVTLAGSGVRYVDGMLRDVRRSGTGRSVALAGVTRVFVAWRGLAGDYELLMKKLCGAFGLLKSL